MVYAFAIIGAAGVYGMFYALRGILETWTPANSEVLRKQDGAWGSFND